MSNFEYIGVFKQNNAMTITDANKFFEQSCNKCCFSGRNMSCKTCHIAGAYEAKINLLRTNSINAPHIP